MGSRRANPLHLTHAYNLPKVVCGEDSSRKRRTSSREDLEADANPCQACLYAVRKGSAPTPAAAPEAKKAARPREWHPSQGPAPQLLALTLHQPWQEAFFLGGPEWWKDTENRSERFHELAPGTLLALHTSQTYSPEGAEFIAKRLPKLELEPGDLPRMEPGMIVGVVQVECVTHGGNGRAHNRPPPRPHSPWYMSQGCGVWLTERRVRFPRPIAAGPGQFGAWHLPEPVRRAVYAQLLGRPAVPQVLAERPHSNGSGHEWTLAVGGSPVDVHLYDWGTVQVVAGPNLADWGSHLGLTAAGRLRPIPARAINEGFPHEVDAQHSTEWLEQHPAEAASVEAFFTHRPELAMKVRQVPE